MGVACGEPSSRTVAITPQFRSVKSFACFSLSFAIDRSSFARRVQVGENARRGFPTPGGSIALAEGDHPLDRPPRPLGDLRLDRYLVLPVAQRVAQLLERDHLHVLAG